jgi:iron complex transport system ATP-binding protein
MSPSLVEIEQLTTGYSGKPVLRNVDWNVRESQRWAVIGKNGTGKSTLVKVIAGLLRPVRGNVRIGGKEIIRYLSRERAQRIAYVPQKMEASVPYTVHDFVMLGRYSRMGLFGTPGQTDRMAVAEALEMCDVHMLCGRMMNTLSGGEVQRVLLSGALAQETELLLLDEPTTFLDPAHERLFLRALEKAQTTRSITTIMVTHDINAALASCSHILALIDGAAFFAGTLQEFRAQCPEILRTVYGITFAGYSNKNYGKEVYGTWNVETT